MIHHENFKMNNNNKCWCPCLCEVWIEAVKPYEKKEWKNLCISSPSSLHIYMCYVLNRISVTDEDKISSWILKSTVVTRRRASITDFIQQVKENYFFYCYAFSLMPPSMCFATRVDVLKSDFGSEWKSLLCHRILLKYTFCEYNARKILEELKTSLVILILFWL